MPIEKSSLIIGQENRGVPLRTNYILIDFENVQPKALSSIDAERFKIIVFVGASQKKIAIDSAAALQRMGSNVEYIKITGNGSNALDFHIVFYIGQLATQDPSAHFHIISKDTGFDPLIQHLKAKKISVTRSRDVSSISLTKPTNKKSAAEMIEITIANLQQRGASKPRTLKTLSSTIDSIFQKQLSDKELDLLVKALRNKRIVTVSDTKVSYTFPQ